MDRSQLRYVLEFLASAEKQLRSMGQERRVRDARASIDGAAQLIQKELNAQETGPVAGEEENLDFGQSYHDPED